MDSYLCWVGATAPNGPRLGLPASGATPFREEVDLNAGAGEACSLPPGGLCPDCQVPLSLVDLAHVCPQCRVETRAVESLEAIAADKNGPARAKASMPKGRLTIVGPGRHQYQGTLHGICPIRTTEMQIVHLYRELMAYNTKYEARGGDPFPLKVLHETAKCYNQVQQIEVKRSDEKRSILAAMVFHTCLQMGFFRKRDEASSFVGLTHVGISRGEGYLSQKISEGLLVFDLDCDPLLPGMVTAFHKLGLDRKTQGSLWEAAFQLVTRADEKSIGFRSELNSKIYGALVEVLVRAEGGEWGRGKLQKTMARVCKQGEVNANTLTGFLTNLHRYHSKFRDIYKKHGLPDGRGLGWAPSAASRKKGKK